MHGIAFVDSAVFFIEHSDQPPILQTDKRKSPEFSSIEVILSDFSFYIESIR
jgi:hypothetical protein